MTGFIRHLAACSMLTLAVPATVFTLSGCDNKETVLDVDTPEGGIEIERDVDTGEIEVDD